MNILQIIPNAELGGAEKHTLLISIAFARLGHNVVLIHPPGPYSKFYNEATTFGVDVYEIPELRNSSVFKAKEIVEEIIISKDIDVIHSHKYRADFITALIKDKVKDIKCFTTIHDQINKDNPWWKKPHKFFPYYLASFWSMRKLDFIVATSSPVKKSIKKLLFLSDKRVKNIPNAIDIIEINNKLNTVKIDIKKEFGLPSDSFVISCAAALEDRKGQEFLIKAIGLLPEELKGKVYVLLMGAGPRLKDYVYLAKELDVEKQIKFLGFRSDVINIMKESDLYIQPSLIDPLPRALLEAMFIDVPVIASAVDGIPDVIKDMETGLLIEPKSSQQIADAIYSIYSSVENTKKYTRNAKNLILNNHTMENMAKKIISELVKISK